MKSSEINTPDDVRRFIQEELVPHQHDVKGGDCERASSALHDLQDRVLQLIANDPARDGWSRALAQAALTTNELYLCRFSW